MKQELRMKIENGIITDEHIETIGSFLETIMPLCFDGREEWKSLTDKINEGNGKSYSGPDLKVKKYFKGGKLYEIFIEPVDTKEDRRKFTTYLKGSYIDNMRKEALERNITAADILNEMLEKRYK